MGIFPKDRDLSVAPEKVELRVDASFYRRRVEEINVRLDRFLGDHLKWRSRNSIQTLIRDGFVLLDATTPDHPLGTGAPRVERRPGRRLRHGARVTVVIPEELRIQTPLASAEPVTVLYEDDEVVAIDKPADVTVHPSGRHLADTLIQRVHARYRSEIDGGRLAPRLCHRLDRETSGIVLVGKRSRSHGYVMQQFERHSIEKEYLAIVRGEPAAERGRISYPIGPARASRIRLKMAVVADGQPSLTEWWVEERLHRHTLVRCRLHTGRQHQIRVHLAAIGHPIVGDKLYGSDEALFQRSVDGALDDRDERELGLPRHALHHARLVFRTPAGRRPVEVVSELPQDLRGFVVGQTLARSGGAERT